MKTYTSYDELPAVLTAKELAAILRISRSSAYLLMAKEGFPSVSVGKRRIVPKSLFISWLEGQATQLQCRHKP